ncbi:MAG: signal peptidase II [Planctomycetota bacterium]
MKTYAPAGRCRRAWLCFIAVFVLLLGVDLVSKYVAFAWVGDRPVTLVRDWDAFEAYRVEDPPTQDLVIVSSDPFGELIQTPGRVVVPSVLNLKLHTNTGAVFGLGAGKRWVFVSVSVVAVFVLAWLFWFSPRGAWIYHVALALVLAGALGNLYDRVIYGAVRDMLHMLPGVDLPFGLRWPGQQGMPGSSEVWPWVFNVADVSLLAGVAGVMIETWRGVGIPDGAKPDKVGEERVVDTQSRETQAGEQA